MVRPQSQQGAHNKREQKDLVAWLVTGVKLIGQRHVITMHTVCGKRATCKLLVNALYTRAVMKDIDMKKVLYNQLQ